MAQRRVARPRKEVMKTIITAILCIALVTPCSAPPVPPPGNGFTAVEVVLAITIVAIGATAVYVVIKCARKLDRPPTVERSTNRVDWSTSGEMFVSMDGANYVYYEPIEAGPVFYRAKR